MGIMESSLAETVSDVVRRHLPNGESLGEIDENAELQLLGLDSMKSISMLLELENAFGITFPDDLLSPENYQTLRALKALVLSVRNP
jgi:acyl carrier protein